MRQMLISNKSRDSFKIKYACKYGYRIWLYIACQLSIRGNTNVSICFNDHVPTFSDISVSQSVLSTLHGVGRQQRVEIDIFIRRIQKGEKIKFEKIMSDNVFQSQSDDREMAAPNPGLR